MMDDNTKERISGLSPEKLALLIKKLKKDGSSSDDRIIRKRSDSNEYPMSSEQKGIWFLQQLQPDSTFYNIPAAIRFKGSLNIKALCDALRTIILRHEVLRANFTVQSDKPCQIIRHLDDQFVEISVLDYSDNEELHSKMDQIIASEKNKKFNLTEDSLIRARLFILGREDYLLLLTFHHIVSDGWSIGLFIKELSAFYAAYSENKDSLLKELPIQYSDYAAWQENYLQSENYEKALAYWKGKLSEMPMELSLPLDKKRPSSQSFKGAHYSFSISSEAAIRIRQYCRSENKSEFVFYLSAFEILLSRYSNQEEFGIGVPVANRSKIKTQELIGLFTNTVTIRSDLRKNPTMKEILQRTNSTALEAFEYQECPFERVANAVAPDHNTSISPVFQVMFDFITRPLYTLDLPGLDIEIVEFERETSKYDLTLSVEEGEEEYKCTFEYSTDLFLEETIKRMAEHFLNITQAILADQKMSLSEIQLLSEKEQNIILYEWNNTDHPYPKDETFHHMFELQVEKTPDRIAVVYEDNKLTFRELNRRANRLAHLLISKGIGPEELIGIYMERSVDIMVGIFAILKAGGAYIPLDIHSPFQRLSMILKDTKIPIILTQSSLKGKLNLEGIDLICVDQLQESSTAFDDSNPQTAAGPQNLAYIIYTSGSTGRPKGAMILHHSIINLVYALEKNIYERALNIRKSKNLIQGGDSSEILSSRPLNLLMNSSLIFDASIQQMILIIRGHTIYILPDEIRREGQAFINYIRKNRIEVLDCVPSQLAMLLESGFLDETDYCPALVMPGGEAISEHMWKELSRSYKIEWFNMYGPTETTVEVTAAYINNSECRPVIGKPLNNVRLYILDKNYRPQPVGVTGELFIAGECLGRGYLNRPEISAEKLIPNPFAKKSGERIYRTGDLARYTPKGDVEYMGRCDNQVKIRGFRIELGEIESAVNQIPGVKEAVVLIREDAINDKKIVAYIVPKDSEFYLPQDIKQILKGKLPEYMVPAHIIILEKLPLMPSGKIDKKMLPLPLQNENELTIGYIPPSTDLECELVQIFENILNVKKIGLKDNFFESGGDSIKAAIFINRIQTRYKLNVPVKSIFENATILDFSGYLLKAFPEKFSNSSSSFSELKQIAKAPDDKILLSFAQERLWFLEQLEPGSPFYNIPIMFRIEGDLNTGLLDQSLNEIVKRHEILRTSISTEEGQAKPLEAEEVNIKSTVVDIARFSKDQQEQLIQNYASEEAEKAIPIDILPLFRILILALSEKDHLMIATFHHIIMDEWSSRVMLKELSEIYSALKENRSIPLPELKLQYKDYAFWQREFLKGENLKRQLEYWTGKLRGIPACLELPVDHPRPLIQTFRGDFISQRLSPEVARKVREFNRNHGVTLFMTMLSVFQTLLYRLTSQSDIVVGTPVANRNREEIEPLIGFFVNTLVLRARVSKQMRFLELLRETQENSLEAYTFQDLPFEMLVDHLQPERSLSHSPIFQVMFAIQNLHLQDYELTSGLRLNPYEVHSHTSKYDLTMFISEESEQCLTMALEYNTDLFERGSAERMIRNYEMIIESIVKYPEQRISEIALLSPEEEMLVVRRALENKSPEEGRVTGGHRLAMRLLKEESLEEVIRNWNKTDSDYQKDETLQRLFELQAEKTPHKMALMYLDETLTFRELNERANSLAYHLISKGVGPGDLVGIYMERSVDMIVAIMGILKSGAGYLPLDISSPRQRISTIIEETESKVVLTQKNLSHRLSLGNTSIVALDDPEGEYCESNYESLKGINPPQRSQSGNTAYVIFTSGSTGRPKGVVIEHRSVVNLLNDLYGNIYSRLHLDDPDLIVSMNAPVIFDVSVQHIIMLLKGITLNIIPEEIRRDGEALLSHIRSYRIGVLDCVPSQLRILLESGLLEEASWMPSAVIAAGEAIDESTWRKLSKSDKIEFFNAYGPTEATVYVTRHHINDKNHIIGTSDIPVIGKPLSNTRFYILDEDLKSQPIGVTGELFIAGDCLSRGYFRRPEMTSEKFIPDPFSTTPGGRLYRTGDLARFTPHGEVEYLGRSDNQVKLRGFRIELGEIEQVLMQHPRVKEAVVVVKERKGSKYLSAYICLRDQAMLHEGSSSRENSKVKSTETDTSGLNTSEMREFLKRVLPEYMIPAFFTTLEKFPLTPTGKIDRKSLPEEVFHESKEKDEGPETENERILLEIWKEVLSLEKLSVHDNFFESGGDSILAIQVVAKANKTGLKINTKQIFQYPTIYQLSRVAKTSSIIHERIMKEGSIPLTPIQKWFFEQNLVQINHWNQSVLLQVREKIDIKLLNDIFNTIIQHNDAFHLRYKFSSIGMTKWGQYYFRQEDNIGVEKIDLSSFGNTLISKAIQDNASRIQSELNITAGPLIRIAYFDTGPDRNDLLLIIIHHLIVDGISWRILLKEVEMLFTQAKRNQELKLYASGSSFQEWCFRIDELSQSDQIKRDTEFWSDFGKRKFHALPVDFNRKENTEASGCTITSVYDELRTSQLIHQINSKYHTKTNEILLSALLQTFARWTGQHNLLLEIEGHGRDLILDNLEVSDTIGWFTNIFPVWLESKKISDTGYTICAVKEQLRSIPNNGISYGMLKYSNDQEVSAFLKDIPSSQISFNYLGQFDQLKSEGFIFDMANEGKGIERGLENRRRYLIDVSAIIVNGCLNVQWIFSSSIYRPQTIQTLADNLLSEITRIIDHCLEDKASTYTPSDFQDVQIKQEELKDILSEIDGNDDE